MMAKLYDKCLKVGLRMTLPRKVILEVIEDSIDHPDVEEMYRRAVVKDKTISIAKQYKCEIISKKWKNYSTQFNFAVRYIKAKYEWILRIERM